MMLQINFIHSLRPLSPSGPGAVRQLWRVPGSESKVVRLSLPRQKQTVGVIRVKLGSGPARDSPGVNGQTGLLIKAGARFYGLPVSESSGVIFRISF